MFEVIKSYIQIKYSVIEYIDCIFLEEINSIPLFQPYLEVKDMKSFSKPVFEILPNIR